MSNPDKVAAGRIGAHVSWANTTDPSARTAPGRAAFLDRFEREVDPDGLLAPEDRARRADARGLSSRPRKYEVKPKNLRVNGSVIKGYSREDLHDVFLRYLPQDAATAATPATPPAEIEDPVFPDWMSETA